MGTLSPVMFAGIDATTLAEIWIGSVVKCSVVLLAALLMLAIWRRGAAVTKHFVLTLALSGVLVIPLGSAFALALRSLWLPGINGSAMLQGAMGGVVLGDLVVNTGFTLPDWWTLVLFLWLSGVALLVLREIGGRLRIGTLLRQARPVEDLEIQRLHAQCVAELRIRRPVRLLVHSEQPVPFTCGLLRPAVVLTPRELNGRHDHTRRILLHELAHVARCDVFANAIARWATALLWFNPLVWIAGRRLRAEQERACDDRVLHVGESAAEYAALLLDYARHLRRMPSLWPEAITFVRAASLRARIHALLDPSPRVRRARGLTLASLVLVAAAGMLVLSCVRTPTAEKSATDLAAAEALPSADEFIEVDEMPEMLETAEPEYPKALAEAKIIGDVWIRALVDADGTVREAHPVNPNVHDEFNTAAVDAAYRNKFKPARRDGKPVSIWVTYKVSFRLPGADENADC